mgnify:CR=1 FL=1
MRTVEIIGYKRANLGKSESKHLRNEGNVPCVLYGGTEQVHIYAAAIQFRDVIYTPAACFVKLNIEGTEYTAVLQDSQFHPVSENLLHADFLQLFEGKPVKMDIPVKTVGNSPGVANGGALTVKRPKLSVLALPKNMPENIEVDISTLKLGKSTKVGDLPAGDYEIQNSPLVTIASVAVPRALRGKSEDELDEAQEEGEE